MLLGLPNTGTDWFSEQICAANPNLRYYREFFNPICNPNHSNALSQIFGCELPNTIEQIARPCAWEKYKDIVQQTWSQRNINFTKENYSIWKIHYHHQLFNCFVLHRELDFCLPAKTRRVDDVNSWYMAIYTSAVKNIEFLQKDILPLVEFAQNHADTVNKKVVSAYFIGYRQTLNTAAELNLPIIEYEKLMTLDLEKLQSYLKQLTVADPVKLAQRIIGSRRPRTKTIDKFDCADFINELKKVENGRT